MPQTMTDNSLMDRTIERASARRDKTITAYNDMLARLQALQAQFSAYDTDDQSEDCPVRTKIKCKLESAGSLLPKAEKLSGNPTSTKSFGRTATRIRSQLDEAQTALSDLLSPDATPTGMTPG